MTVLNLTLLLQKEDIHLGTVTVKGADWNGVMEAARRIFVVSKSTSTRIQWNIGLWLQCFHDNIVITTKCLWPLHWRGCVMAVQFNLLIFQIMLICAPWNLMLPKNSLLMIHSIIRLHDSRFFSKNWVDVAQVPSLALCFQPRSRPFVWLLAHTWIFEKYGLFCSLQHYNQTLQTKKWIWKNC